MPATCAGKGEMMREPNLLARLTNLNTEKNEKWGLVLSGGGTRGAYEVGAWRALRELKVPIRGIAGTSIGALNAAMFLCCDLKKIMEIYRNIKLTDVLPVSGNIDPDKNVFDRSNLLAIMREYVVQHGLDNGPLRNLLQMNLDTDKIYASPLDLGIVTFDVQSREPLRIFKEDIDRSRFIDYLLASANFPIYKTHNLNGKKLWDGGLYDNMPFNLLIERGYTHLAVVDINGIGLTQKVENAEKISLKMISCSEDLGGTFDFNHERIEKNLTLGYLDTLKAFHKLFGNYYFFRRPAFNDLLLNFDLETISGLEHAAKYYKIDRCRIFTADEFLNELAFCHQMTERRNAQEGIDRLDVLDLRRQLQSGAAIPLLVNLFTEQPLLRSGALAKAFPEAASAASAMIELRNYRKM